MNIDESNNQREHVTCDVCEQRVNECQNRTLLKTLKVANSKKLNLKKEINTFLIAYRSTPHQTTGVTPAELMFKRKIRTKLPQLTLLFSQKLMIKQGKGIKFQNSRVN